MIDKTQNPGTHLPHDENKCAGSYVQHIQASIAMTLGLGVVCCIIYPAVVWGLSQLIFPVRANGSLVKKDGTPTTNPAEAVGSSLIGQPFSANQYFWPRPSAAGNGYDPTSSGGSNLGPLSDKLINGIVTTQPSTQPITVASTGPASQPSIIETLAFDGVRLRCIHYAVANNIAFKLYHVKYNDDGSITKLDEVPISKFEDSSGNLMDTALADAFPHPPSDSADRIPVVAADFAVPIPGDAVTASGSGLDPHISPANAKLQTHRVAVARGIMDDQVAKLIGVHTDGPNLGFLGDPGVNVGLLNLDLDKQYPLPAPPATQPAAQSARGP